MSYFDYKAEFGRFRRKYRFLGTIFANFHFMLKWILRQHDTLATDQNINPDEHNRPLFILRNSYKRAFEVWSKVYMYRQGKWGCKDQESFFDYVYHSLAQKAIRFLIDFWSTMYQEDTIYRELTNMWLFELQFQMNASFNPDRENVHVLYTATTKDDPDYWRLKEEVARKMREADAGKTPNERWHQHLDHIKQETYAKRRMHLERSQLKARLDDIDKALLELEAEK